MSELDGADPVKLLSSDGSVLITGTGAIDLRAASAGPLVTSFRFLEPPAAQIAPGGPGTFQTLFLVPGGVIVTTLGRVLLDFDAAIQISPPAPTPGGTTEGVSLQYLWDGAPLSTNTFFQITATGITANSAFAMVARFKGLTPAAAPGVHTLEVQWA